MLRSNQSWFFRAKIQRRRTACYAATKVGSFERRYNGGRQSHNGTLKAPWFMTDVAAAAHHVTTAGVRNGEKTGPGLAKDLT
eukprot:586818-Hanusia_phi.AAC.1